MKLIIVIMLTGFLQVSVAAYGQRITLSEKNITIEKLFKQIEKQSNYSFFYKPDELKGLPKIDVNVKDASIKEVLDKCF